MAENGVAEKQVLNGDNADAEADPKASEENGDADAGEKSQKKRNRPKKKKTDDSKSSAGAKVQTEPPSVPISALFPSGTFPVGQEMEYPVPQDGQTAKDRFTSEEARALDRAQLDMYNEIRQVSR